MQLHELKPTKARTTAKRVGRGGKRGKTSGRGHKGQKARSGGGVRTGFEGGAMPLYMRLPKKGFSNAPFKTEYAIVNLDALEAKFDGGEVTRESLIEKGLLSGIEKRRPIKILGNGTLTKKLTFVKIDKFSGSAKEAIEKAGGEIK